MKMKGIKYCKRRLFRLCYFRRISREQRDASVSRFAYECSINLKERDTIFEKYKRMIKDDYRINPFILIPFIVSVVSVVSSLLYTIPITCALLQTYDLIPYFSFDYPTWLIAVMALYFVLVPLSLIYTLLGVIIGKIKFYNYRYNWLLLSLQVFLPICDILYLIYVWCIGTTIL